MQLTEKIKQTEAALAKTKSPYARRDLEKHLARLKREQKKQGR